MLFGNSMTHARRSIIRSAAVGAGAGVAATMAMSSVMLAARQMGLRAELPPVLIAEETVEAVSHRQAKPGEERALATVAHFGFGALAGALYGSAAGGVRRGALAGVLGILFGSAVWLVSYQGWIPVLGIMPPASRDHPGRVGTMLAAHWIYGAALGVTAHRLRWLTRS